jgi:hypothetical protein
MLGFGSDRAPGHTASLGKFSRRRRGLSTSVPSCVRLRDVGCGWTLGVTVLAIVKAVLGTGWKTERGTKAIALYIGTAAKWAWTKIHIIHVPASAIMLADALGTYVTLPHSHSFELPLAFRAL